MGFRGFVASVLALALVVGVPLLPSATWHLRDTRERAIVIVDKTVPRADRREHAAFVWLLNHHRIVQRDSGREFDAGRDYFGYHPTRPAGKRVRPLAVEPGSADLVYLADAEGVYAGDAAQQLAAGGAAAREARTGKDSDGAGQQPRARRPAGQAKQATAQHRSRRLVHGGITPAEVATIRAGLRRGGTLIAEYNTLGAPTSEKAREQLGAMLGVRPTGWVGRWYDELDVDGPVPPDVRARWEAAGSDRTWTFEGSGYVLAHTDGRVVVLVEGTHLGATGLRLTFPPATQRSYGVPASFAYDHWFDIVQPRDGAEVLGTYELAVSDNARAALKRAGIPTQFPAVVSRTHEQYRGLYLAGDFGDHAALPASHRRAWLPQWKTRTNPPQRGAREAFLWHVYAPLMTGLLADMELA